MRRKEQRRRKERRNVADMLMAAIGAGWDPMLIQGGGKLWRAPETFDTGRVACFVSDAAL